MKHTTKKMVILGLDGATFKIIDELIPLGLLPNIEKLISSGISATLRSTIHPITPTAWSSFITGTNAGKHGIFDFRVKKSGSYSLNLTNGGARKSQSFWKVLGDHGYSSGVVNVPYTYPPEPMSGYMIPGFDAPTLSGEHSFPPGIYEEIVQAVGSYELKGTFPVGIRMSEFDTGLVESVVKNRIESAKYLLDKHPTDLFVLVFNETDHMQHLFWRYMDDLKEPSLSAQAERYGNLIFEAYKQADRAIGEILNTYSESPNVLVVSDHGATRIKKVLNLNQLLREHGYLHYTSRNDKNEVALTQKILRRLKSLVKRLVGEDGIDWLKKRFLNVLDYAESISQLGDLDWHKTRAFAHGSFGNISLNIIGREPNGCIRSDQVEQTKNEIRKLLMELRDPDNGERVVEKVHYREDLFKGDQLENAPDILIEFAGYAYYCPPPSDLQNTQIFQDVSVIESTDIERSGTHDLNGILIAAGPDIASRKDRLEASILDIAPTVLHLFEQDVPTDMDGKVLTGILKDSSRSVRFAKPKDDLTSPESVSKGYSADEEKVINERLSSLGYLE